MRGGAWEPLSMGGGSSGCNAQPSDNFAPSSGHDDNTTGDFIDFSSTHNSSTDFMSFSNTGDFSAEAAGGGAGAGAGSGWVR